MAEYIEKGIALATLSKYGITRNMRTNKAVAEIPAADVVPVVRCRECIHWHDWGACGHPDNGFDSPPMGPDDFCSKGEPKNELE